MFCKNARSKLAMASNGGNTSTSTEGSSTATPSSENAPNPADKEVPEAGALNKQVDPPVVSSRSPPASSPSSGQLLPISRQGGDNKNSSVTSSGNFNQTLGNPGFPSSVVSPLPSTALLAALAQQKLSDSQLFMSSGGTNIQLLQRQMDLIQEEQRKQMEYLQRQHALQLQSLKSLAGMSLNGNGGGPGANGTVGSTPSALNMGRALQQPHGNFQIQQQALAQRQFQQQSQQQPMMQGGAPGAFQQPGQAASGLQPSFGQRGSMVSGSPPGLAQQQTPHSFLPNGGLAANPMSTSVMGTLSGQQVNPTAFNNAGVLPALLNPDATRLLQMRDVMNAKKQQRDREGPTNARASAA
jgi:hypothetical protein